MIRWRSWILLAFMGYPETLAAGWNSISKRNTLSRLQASGQGSRNIKPDVVVFNTKQTPEERVPLP